MAASKAVVTIDGIELAGNSSFVWKIQTGVAPYTTVAEVHKTTWEQFLKDRTGKPLTLKIKDSRGTSVTIEEVYILHNYPSSSPNRVAVVLSDRRWKWQNKFIHRDYNIPKKSGDRSVAQDVPFTSQVVVDLFDYKEYSLKNGYKWTPKEAISDVLTQLTEGEATTYFIESFPIDDDKAENGGQFSMQSVILRDQGDVALARLMGYVPGADLYVSELGQVIVFDAVDLKKGEEHYKKLPGATWDGDAVTVIDRKAIRPSEVRVHYQREVELLLEYEDNYSGGTAAAPSSTAPYLTNVIPTTDVETYLVGYEGPVPQGTWVPFATWLEAMNEIRPTSSEPWTFDTLRKFWVTGLEGVLGARGDDLDSDGDVPARIGAIHQHFRQSFQINPRYMDRISEIQEVRVGIIDPASGGRGPSHVWGQACMIPNQKGQMMAARDYSTLANSYLNVDHYPDDGANVRSKVPAPARIQFLDRDQGIFHVTWDKSPQGTIASWVPCHLVGETGEVPTTKSRDLYFQDIDPMGDGIKVQGGANGQLLAQSMKLKVMVTIVPGAPNNKSLYHVEKVTAEQIEKIYKSEYNIKDGKGPVLEVFVAPNEETARFGWFNDADAKSTVSIMLGLTSDDPTTAGLPQGTTELSGYVITNQQRELPGHAASVASEVLAAFADSRTGMHSTILGQPGGDGQLSLKGRKSAVTVQVGGYPSAKVSVAHSYPEQNKPISRLAVMPESVRRIVLKVIPLSKPAV